MAIDEKVYDTEHPRVARKLSALAGLIETPGIRAIEGAVLDQALAMDLPFIPKATDFEATARALRERALSIWERIYHPEYYSVRHLRSRLGRAAPRPLRASPEPVAVPQPPRTPIESVGDDAPLCQAWPQLRDPGPGDTSDGEP